MVRRAWLGTLVLAVAAGCSGATPSSVPLATFPPALQPAATGATTAPTAAPAATPAPTQAPTPQSTIAPTSTAAPTPTRSSTPTAVPTAPPTLAPASAAGGSPSSTPLDISAYLTADLGVLSATEQDVGVVVSYVDETTGEAQPVVTLTLAMGDVLAQRVPAGTFVIAIVRTPGAKPTESCTFAVDDGQAVEFAITDDSVIVSASKLQPKTSSDLLLATSPLCRR
jgi:hypothetical protein